MPAEQVPTSDGLTQRLFQHQRGAQAARGASPVQSRGVSESSYQRLLEQTQSPLDNAAAAQNVARSSHQHWQLHPSTLRRRRPLQITNTSIRRPCKGAGTFPAKRSLL